MASKRQTNKFLKEFGAALEHRPDYYIDGADSLLRGFGQKNVSAVDAFTVMLLASAGLARIAGADEMQYMKCAFEAWLSVDVVPDEARSAKGD